MEDTSLIEALKQKRSDAMDFRNDQALQLYYHKADGVFFANEYCFGGKLESKTELSLEQFSLYLYSLQAHKIEKHSTLYNLERVDGRMARKRAIAGKRYWDAEFEASL